MTRILIVDDEPQLLRALRINLLARQYEVATAADGAEALHAAQHQHPDLVILDLGLPDIDGVEVIRRLRAWSSVPVVVLSGRIDSRQKVDALDAGADDYLTKPFSVEELLARIRAVTRRQPGTDLVAKQESISLGRTTVNFADHTAHRPAGDGDGETLAEIHLTKTEWRLLEMLLSNPGKLVSQRQLLHDIWGPTYHQETQYLRQYMAQLRRKLEADPSRPRYLLTEPGMGYRYRP